MPKIVVAFDSFKGCLSAEVACQTAAEAIRSSHPSTQVIEIPMSDGGEGLVHAVKGYMSAVHDVQLQSICLRAHGPLMEPVTAEYIISADGRTAYMEMASTCGLPLVPIDRRNPMLTTTYGVGELIADAIGRGVEQIIMGIGGSATNDGGEGMIQALYELGIDPDTQKVKITVACDVTNPLCGPNGASAVFAPQKGATPAMVQLLDTRLREFAERTIAAGKATPAMMDYPGAGAAGGLGFGLMAYLHAELKSGIDILLDIVGFDQQLNETDWVLTGEGKSDEQTLMGKVPHGLLKRCQKADVPIILLSGAIEDPHGQLAQAFHQVASINANDHRPLAELMRPDVAKQNLQQAVIEALKGKI